MSDFFPGALAGLIIAFFAGIVIGFVASDGLGRTRQDSGRHFEVRERGQQFTNPLLECASTSDASENETLRPFRHKVESVRARIISSGIAKSISVYFRDLNNGPWFSIDPVVCHAPSSLLKIPLMMAVFKEAETNPGILGKKVIFRLVDGVDLNAYQYVQPSETLMPGESYSIEDLLYRMIVLSDNNATAMLQGGLSPSMLDRTYAELGIRNPYVGSSGYVMSVDDCASFFRVLFNASYLNKEMSERALRLLSLTEFRDGLAGGLPPTVAIAHKFGERATGDHYETKELHECGIIYYPNHPYLLCVMTSGSSLPQLSGAIQEISRTVYAEISGQHTAK